MYIEKKVKSNIWDNVNLVLIFLLFISYLGHSNIRILYYVATALLIVFEGVKIILVGKGKLVFSKHLIWYLVFSIFGLISILWSFNKEYTFTGFKNTILIFFNIMGILLYTTDKEKLKNVMKMFLYACVYMCLILIFFEKSEIKNDYGQVVGLYFNTIAMSLAIGIVFAVYIFRVTNQKKWILFIVLFYYIIFVTGSRKGLLFPTVIIILTLIFEMGSSAKKAVKNVMVLIAVVFVIGFIVYNDDNLYNRMNLLLDSFLGESVDEASINERAYYRNVAMELFSEHPVLGNGLNSFTAYLAYNGYWHVAYSHCNYTELLSGIGLIGFCIYYFQYFYIFAFSLKNFNNKSIDKILPLIFIAVYFVFEYGMVTYYDFSTHIAIAIIYCLNELNRKEGYRYEKNNRMFEKS